LIENISKYTGALADTAHAQETSSQSRSGAGKPLSAQGTSNAQVAPLSLGDPAHQARLAALTRAVQSGQYQVSSSAISKSLLQESRAWLTHAAK
jgi:anti-sigma28 factor (negative regulator of flagellin synthesis)